MVDHRGAIAEHDRTHLKESATEKLARQRREAEEVEQRARQQLNAQRSEDWQGWFKGSLYAELMSGKNPLIDGLGEVIATERAARRKEVQAAVEEQERKHDAKLKILEQRQQQAQQEQTANNQAAWEKFYGAALATERAARQKEVKAAIEEAERAFETKLEALERRIVQHIEQHTDQCNHGIVVSAGRAETLGKMIETERTDRQKEIKATVEDAQRAFETKLAPLEQRIIQHTDQRIIQHIEQCSGRNHALSDAIATERVDRQKGVKTAVEEAQHSVEVKLEALEQRLKAVPGKLPVAKTWHPETVVYQAELSAMRARSTKRSGTLHNLPAARTGSALPVPAAMRSRQMSAAPLARTKPTSSWTSSYPMVPLSSPGTIVRVSVRETDGNS